MSVMESFDFTSVPGIGDLMQLTGIANGWMLVAGILLLLAVIFLIGWLSASSKARAARRELAQVREELVGAQALVNLPPLHEGDYDYLSGDDPGTSLVFASARELRHRKGAAAAPAAAAKPAAAPENPQPQAAPQPAAAPRQDEPSVTAQVHEAIFASVTGGRLGQTQPAAEGDMVGNRRRKANGAAITSSDLPPIKREAAPQPDAAAPAQGCADEDPSLSSRIPRL